jgi:type II secretory pathway pseudopilin PulG
MSPTRTSERGFTLAGLIVILTIIAIFIAYTVPQQWSKVMARERDKQTIFIMKQYAMAIRAYQLKNNAVPTSLDQIKQARTPRLIRGPGEWICPLTGKADWVVIPASAAQAASPQNPALPQPVRRMSSSPAAPLPSGQRPAQGQPGQIVGPIIGVRPNKTGPSFMSLNGATNYEEWSYTTIDLENEIQGRRASLMTK